MSIRRAAALSAWPAFVLSGLLVLALSAWGPSLAAMWVSPVTAFSLVLVSASLCTFGAVVVVVLGWRWRIAELAILGAALSVASLLPLAHGLTVPGVVYDDNSATTVAALAATPLALLAALPVLAPERAYARAISRRWRTWVTISILTTTALAGALLASPDLVPAPRAGQPITYAAVAVSLGGTAILSLRQLRLYRIGRRPASLVASIGFAYLGISALVWLVADPYSTAWWTAHFADALGVLAAAGGLWRAHTGDRSLTWALRPLVNRDPLIALELGLSPVVHRFVMALEQKDPLTRDHVVRVGELAMRLGVRLRLNPEHLRNLGLAALLHDVGKLLAEADLLRKADVLSESEFEKVKEHPVHGAELMAASPLLAGAAPFVRWHHERFDGAGYPDGLSGEEIPVEAAIISVCDAWDAMTFARPYRSARPHAAATRVLIDGAGSQWSPRVVDLLLAELEGHGPVVLPVFDEVGRGSLAGRECAPDVHVGARRRLVAGVHGR